jgi:hypothetical protein
MKYTLYRENWKFVNTFVFGSVKPVNGIPTPLLRNNF